MTGCSRAVPEHECSASNVCRHMRQQEMYSEVPVPKALEGGKSFEFLRRDLRRTGLTGGGGPSKWPPLQLAHALTVRSAFSSLHPGPKLALSGAASSLLVLHAWDVEAPSLCHACIAPTKSLVEGTSLCLWPQARRWVDRAGAPAAATSTAACMAAATAAHRACPQSPRAACSAATAAVATSHPARHQSAARDPCSKRASKFFSGRGLWVFAHRSL